MQYPSDSGSMRRSIVEPRDEGVLGRALVVSADSAAGFALVELLEQRHFRVEASDAEKLQRAEPAECAARLQAIDFLVLRAAPSELDPVLELLRRIRRLQRSLPVAVASPVSSSRSIVEAMKAGAVDYLVEPVAAEALDLALEVAAVGDAPSRAARASPSFQPAAAPPVVWEGAGMQEIRRSLERMQGVDATLLILGESGVGKEVVARYAHDCSSRREEAFVKVNCAALPETLLESELFGYERGAFTGADSRKLGRFELADRGTIFLDEIAEMSAPLQAKLLQVLQDREFTKLGGHREVRVDIRVICATHWDLATLVERGRFRQDLYFRLNVIKLAVPPLRKRPEVIGKLARSFLQHYSARYGRPPARMSRQMESALERYRFPGNVRELENLMKRFAVLGREDLILSALEREPDPAPPIAEPPDSDDLAPNRSLLEVGRRAARRAEEVAIDGALAQTGGNLKRAASLLGVSYKTLLGKTRERRRGGS